MSKVKNSIKNTVSAKKLRLSFQKHAARMRQGRAKK